MKLFATGLAALVIALVSISGPAAEASAPARSPRVVLAVDGIGQTRNLPVLVAERLGYFRDEGLTVTLVDAPGEPTPAQLMADGRADGAVAFYHHTFMTQADDHFVTQAVVVMGGSPQLKLVVASRLRGSVHDAADLAGLKIYTGGRNSGKTTATNWLASRAGFGATGYTPLAPTTRQAMAAALRDGTADAIVAHEPDASYYVRSGAGFALADLSSVSGTREALGSVYPSTTLYFPAPYIAAHPETVQHLVDACLRAITFINGHSAADIAGVLPPKVVGNDRAAFVRLLDEDKKGFATDGRMCRDAARQEWRVMSDLTPKYRDIQFEQTFTDKFVDASDRRPR